ncbi:hypothetical protein APHAL10511_007888 [Amanita phalloides]|nr:hypothetical protein APHAL10511_007888 [Amanita phalloides]
MELHAYLQTNKWSMNPQNLSEYMKNKLIPNVVNKYLQHIISTEMPAGLKKYIELEIIMPWVQLKVAKGISLRTAQWWLQKEGFKYTVHKKALYYDGHKQEDVVDYQQNTFLPMMEKYEQHLVGYTVGNIEVERQLGAGEMKVLVVHDEMTAQAHDGVCMSWVWKGEQPLKKKGQGHGLHQFDVTCLTKGWLKEASQTLEYGKNYDGYWNGELFVKQVHNASEL